MLENSETDAELIKHELSRAGLAPVTKRVDTEEAFASAIPEFAPDIVLLDPTSAQLDAHAALRLLRRLRPITPLIVVSSLNGEKTVASVRAGAEDVILKSHLSRAPSHMPSRSGVRFTGSLPARSKCCAWSRMGTVPAR